MSNEYNRRDFLKMGAIVGAGLVSDSGLSGLAKANNNQKAEKIVKAKERFGFDDNVMIIDNHIHTWPCPEELWAENVDEHTRYIQRMFVVMHKSARRLRDDTLVEDAWKTLFNEKAPSEYKDVNFRFEKRRYLWQANGETYYIPVEYTCVPPEMMISLMDELGIDKAVLQQNVCFRRLSDR